MNQFTSLQHDSVLLGKEDLLPYCMKMSFIFRSGVSWYYWLREKSKSMMNPGNQTEKEKRKKKKRKKKKNS
jgi:hypothetical protein